MNETKHTPGPWEVEVVEDRALIAYAIIGTQWPSETSYNQKLIAAAPELLGVLKVIMLNFGAAAIATGKLEEMKAERWWIVAEAVIAKAEGRT